MGMKTSSLKPKGMINVLPVNPLFWRGESLLLFTFKGLQMLFIEALPGICKSSDPDLGDLHFSRDKDILEDWYACNAFGRL